jgi:hypothetical protein
MTAYFPRLPLGVDPLIPEARERMRRRRAGFAAVLLAAAALTLVLTHSLGARGPAPPRGVAPAFYRLDSTFTVKVDGRKAIRATVYWLRVSPSHWAAKASVVNLTGHALRPVRTSMDTGWGFSALTARQRAHPVQCDGTTCFDSRASSFRPALPRLLPPGARWTGVFSGKPGPWGTMPRNRWAGLGLGGYFGLPGAGGGVSGIGTPLGWAVHIR